MTVVCSYFVIYLKKIYNFYTLFLIYLWIFSNIFNTLKLYAFLKYLM